MKYRRNLPLAHGHFILLNNTISKGDVVVVVGYLKKKYYCQLFNCYGAKKCWNYYRKRAQGIYHTHTQINIFRGRFS